MNPHKLREAAGLLRTAWCRNDYNKDGAVCVMGSIAKVFDPKLTGDHAGIIWEDAAYLALRRDPVLRTTIEEEVDSIFASILEKTPKQIRHLARISNVRDPITRTGHKVCLMNLTVFNSGEDAAAFLERVADKHAQPPPCGVSELLNGPGCGSLPV